LILIFIFYGLALLCLFSLLFLFFCVYFFPAFCYCVSHLPIIKDTFDGDYPEHQHDSIEMSFVTDGEATHVIGRNIKKIKKAT